MANLQPGQHAGSLPRRVDLASYISGYVDGEGCFMVSIAPRPTLRVGWEVRPSFSVSQNSDRDQVLRIIQQYFGCGTLRPDRSDLTMKWEVRNLSLLVSRVVPHFEIYPLLSGKQRDVELFAAVCRRMVRREHLEPEGLVAIVRLVGEMNPSGVRRYSPTRILTSVAEMKA